MIDKAHPPVFERLATLADPTRGRLLALLDRNELTVSELCAIVQLPQSTVSRHLKILSDDGWVISRAEGTSRLYAMDERLEPHGRKLWDLVRDDVTDLAAARHDAIRLRAVLAERRTRSQEFFSRAASQWDALRVDLFGTRTDQFALLALLDDRSTVGDLGCGTGQLSATIAPFVERVIAVDASKAMLGAAKRRLVGVENVDLRVGDLEALPIEDGTLDAGMLALVLHYVAEPLRVLAEAHRALRPGGRLLVVDMLPHDRQEYRQSMGHVWQGFSEEQLGAWAKECGFARFRYRALPADPQAKGPSTFVATGVKE
jgi:ubiquinone/menaquinone biosynthesis C-methylase UbiE/DNA-binding transcriptional ArsR family regulator